MDRNHALRQEVEMIARILTGVFGLALVCVCHAGPAQDFTEGSSKPAEPYVVGLEDLLMISVYDNKELTMSVKVRPDGKISLPIVQDVEVVGRTPAEIADILTEKLSGFFKYSPQVTVIVQEINSFRVYFLGEVAKQGPIQFFRPTRVLQAVATAGGPTEYAKKQITIIREEFGIERRIEIDYKKLLEGAPGQENLYLKPGDTLIFR